MKALAHRLVERLPCETIRLERHRWCECGTAPAAGLERMKTAEHADAGAGLHLAEDLLQIVSSYRRGVEVADQEDVVIARQLPADIDRPGVATA